MMSKEKKKIYKAAIYVRLSKEDGDVVNSSKIESNSISNQKKLIREFLKNKKNIKVVSERVDDGYSGSNFDRPAFKMMIDDIKRGAIDCVVVKDLSRFGREYINAGNYIERLFPSLGVRFIAINDNIDTINESNKSDQIIIPFKNLINDAYCRDISIKIRSHLEIKRKNGEFIGAYTPYGYKKDEHNKNKLVIDTYAANIVKDIFRMKLNGMSQDAIANCLNNKGVLSPMEYKNSIGIHYDTSFKINEIAKWNGVSVKRILENDVYIGTLSQGKVTTPNHKVKIRVEKPESEWVTIKNNHEPIINELDFVIVQRLLGIDTRISPGQENVYPLSGIVVCGGCGSTMIRRNVPVSGKKYSYYVCSNNNANKKCSSHRISAESLENIVLDTIKSHIACILDLKNVLEFIDTVPFQELDIKEIKFKLETKEKELNKCKEYRNMLYEDMKEGIVSKDDYLELHEEYNKKKNNIEEAIRILEKDLENVINSTTDKYEWIDYFAQYNNIEKLTRNIVVKLIEQIRVIDKKNIEVIFLFNDCYEKLINTLEKVGVK